MFHEGTSDADAMFQGVNEESLHALILQQHESDWTIVVVYSDPQRCVR